MTIYHIEFAKAGLGVSGGETWMVSIIKKLSERGHKNVLFTTDNGKQAYERLGLIDGENVEYRLINSFEGEKRMPMFLSYLTRTFTAVRLARESAIDPQGYVMCHSDFFPNTIPFYFLAKRVSEKRRICMMHIICPKLFQGFEKHYAGGFAFPNVRFLHHKLNQALCFTILRRNKSLILTNSVPNEKALHKICPKNSTVNLVHFAATDIERPATYPKKDIDIVWVGRFHKQKGILDLPYITARVKETLPDVQVAIVGGGNEKLEEELLAEIRDLNLEDNIKLLGFLTGSEKDAIICRGKIFAMTSYFESHSIVILETIVLGTPMVSYDLPCHSPYAEGIELTPRFDKHLFADKLLSLLTDKNEYQQLTNRMNKKATEFSWNKTTDELLRAIDVHEIS